MGFRVHFLAVKLKIDIELVLQGGKYLVSHSVKNDVCNINTNKSR